MFARLAVLLVVLAVYVCCSFGQQPTINGATTQYINNGGFESGLLTPGWTAASTPTTYVQVVPKSNAYPAHSGNYLLMIGQQNQASGTAVFASISQNVITPGHGDVFSLSLYMVSPSPLSSELIVYATFNGVQITLASVSQVLGGTYSQITGTFTTPTTSPTTGTLTLYINATSSAGNYLIDDITLTGPSISTVVGDPQFVGLRGQSYQVHGMDGEVYNLITDKSLQVNSRFVFLNSGVCPVVAGKALKNCWSHPGSYLGAVGVQQVVDGKVEQLAITAGSAATGFAAITLNGQALKVGDTYSNGAFSVSYKSEYVIDVVTDLYTFVFDNSDYFINQQVKANVPLSELKSHGLFGQTHQRKMYNSALRYIEGEVDDYVLASQDIFGNDCMYNKFNL